MSQHFDLIVIGAGMGGVGAANTCAQELRVAIVDALPHGGTCALRGCDPKKAVWAAGDSADTDGMPLTPIAVS